MGLVVWLVVAALAVKLFWYIVGITIAIVVVEVGQTRGRSARRAHRGRTASACRDRGASRPATQLDDAG
jgi:hypothetical protein